jgi:hypothetical protein
VPEDKNTVTVWGSRKLVWGAAIVGCLVSAADALTMKADVSISIYRFVSLLAMPGGVGAWYLNLLIQGGHSVTSPAKEFLLSLPFNGLAYWMFIRASAGLVWILSPPKAAG